MLPFFNMMNKQFKNFFWPKSEGGSLGPLWSPGGLMGAPQSPLKFVPEVRYLKHSFVIQNFQYLWLMSSSIGPADWLISRPDNS